MPEQNRQIVMVVDDNKANLAIASSMLKTQYKVYALPSAKGLFDLLETVRPDLILLDNGATQEYEQSAEKNRCPLCGIAMDANGMCPKCGYKQ